MFNLGVCAWPLKDTEPEYMVQIILRVHNGERILPESIFIHAHNNKPAHDDLPFDQLSDREMQVLKLIAKGKKTGRLLLN